MTDVAAATPAANSPQLLLRLLELVARGVRSTRAQHESLGIDPRTVQAYLHAAEWLEMIEGDGTLTALGLEWVFGGRLRSQVFARAVWSNPLAAELLVAADGRLPGIDEVANALAREAPDLAAATLRRRASAVRSLLAPALGRARPRPRSQEDRQLSLPLAPAATTSPVARLEIGAGGREYNPDVYRFLLGTLLEYGELTLGQVRALLDRSGADSLPIGGYVDLALGRGDAVRTQERLVVSPDAVRRRDLAETTTSVMLSDPGYRAYLADAIAAVADRAAEVRRDQTAGRYRAWDRRLFGKIVDPASIVADLDRVLMDRPLASFPIAVRTGFEYRPIHAPFLDVWEEPGLVVAVPQYLAQLQGGLAAANRLLKGVRQASDVALPDLSHRPVIAHAGIIHPGEPMPRNIPDSRSLRQRAVMHSPVIAWITALLLLHRQRSDALDVARGRDGWAIRWRGEERGPLLDAFDDFAEATGWISSRRVSRGLRPETLLAVLEALGAASGVGRRMALAERFFQQLGSEPEEAEVHARLRPLAEAIEGWLDRTEAPAATDSEEGE
jgi:hypothetical protein